MASDGCRAEGACPLSERWVDMGAACVRTLGWNRACGCQESKGQRRGREMSLPWEASRRLLQLIFSKALWLQDVRTEPGRAGPGWGQRGPSALAVSAP